MRWSGRCWCSPGSEVTEAEAAAMAMEAAAMATAAAVRAMAAAVMAAAEMVVSVVEVVRLMGATSSTEG